MSLTRQLPRHRPGQARRLRRATLAAVTAGSLVLVACGSDDDSDRSTASAAAQSGAAGSTGASASGAAGSTAASGSEAPGDPSDAEHPGEDPAASEHRDGGDNGDTEGDDRGGDGGGSREGGARAAASGDDAAQITGVVRGMADQQTQADFNQYTLDNYCAAYIDGHGGRDALQGEVDRLRTDNREVDARVMVDSVDDIRVDGDRATAVTNGTVNGEPSSSSATYQREDGAWKICPTA